MKDPSRTGAAVALLVALHALSSVELTGKFRALPDNRPTLTMIKLTLCCSIFYMNTTHHLPGCGLQIELPPSAAWESGARDLMYERHHQGCK